MRSRQFPRSFYQKKKAFADAYMATFKEHRYQETRFLEVEVRLADSRERQPWWGEGETKNYWARAEGQHQALRDLLLIDQLMGFNDDLIEDRIKRMERNGSADMISVARWVQAQACTKSAK